MPIKFACPSCGKAFNVKDELAGKRAKCACGNVLQIPERAVAAPVETDPLFGDDPLGGDLFGDSSSPAPAASVGDSLFDDEFPSGGTFPVAPAAYPTAPYQSTSYQTAPQQASFGPSTSSYAVAVPTVGPIESSKPEATEMSGGVACLIGIALSGAGALVGAVVWALIAIFTGYEIGWIAWGVGFTSGFGMAFAHHLSDGIDDFLGGVIAGAMAIFGIVAGKYAVYRFVVLAMFNEMGEVAELLEGEISFGWMFGPMDLLFFGLAVATAYKLGSGTFGDDDD